MSFKAKAPSWWFRKNHPMSFFLAPLGGLYGLAVKARFAVTKPYRSALPVVCIGNFTVGGGGKTPLAIESAKLLESAGRRPVFLTRGYGGKTRGPHLVDLSKDSAVEVGDEPLILAQFAPVVVCGDRKKGARFIEKMLGDIIIMDDGFQNPTLHKDLSLIVVDAVVGIGNGWVFPAGPLRAGLSFQLPKTDVLIISGPSPKGVESFASEVERLFTGEILHSDIVARGDVSWLKGAQVSAVTGIARPDKFYGSLQRLGALIVEMYEFPDHHQFSEQDASDILAAVAIDETQIVMTQKDWVRLPETGQRGVLRSRARVLEIELQIDRPRLLLERLEKARGSTR